MIKFYPLRYKLAKLKCIRSYHVQRACFPYGFHRDILKINSLWK